MQHEFDNTIDALLRRAEARRDGEVLPENVEHLDADAFAAFAENVLPDAARARFTAHLADCSDCRQILSTFALTEETEPEEAAATNEVAAAQPTWRERFARWFTAPNLGYAAAALAVLFIGIFGFIALQPKPESQSVEVAQIEPEEEAIAQKRRRAAPAPAAQPEQTPEIVAAPTETPANLDSANANIAESANETAEQSPNRGLPPSYRVITREQSNAAETRRESEPSRESNRAASSTNTATTGNTVAAARPTPTVTTTQAAPETTAAVAAQKPSGQPDAKAKDEPDAERQETAPAGLEATKKSAPAAVAPQNKAILTRTVGGKTFQNVGGVWRDSSYNSQSLITISRGTDEYKKLPTGLRSIAENFRGETVIVLWQGKAYQIQ